MDKITTVLLTVTLARLSSPRSIPYVAAVLHPPVPKDGKWEKTEFYYSLDRTIPNMKYGVKNLTKELSLQPGK
jgi:hypothetical protein